VPFVRAPWRRRIFSTFKRVHSRAIRCDMDCSECWIREIGNLLLAFANRGSGKNFRSRVSWTLCGHLKLRTIQILTSVTLFTEYTGNNGLESPSKPTEARPPYLIDENTKTKQVSVWYSAGSSLQNLRYFFRFVSGCLKQLFSFCYILRSTR